MLGEEIIEQRKGESERRSAKAQLCLKWSHTPEFPSLTLLAFWDELWGCLTHRGRMLNSIHGCYQQMLVAAPPSPDIKNVNRYCPQVLSGDKVNSY
jgi:hypothetical protein